MHQQVSLWGRSRDVRVQELECGGREIGVLSQRAVRGISHAHMSLNEISWRMLEPAINLRVCERVNAKCSASSEQPGE